MYVSEKKYALWQLHPAVLGHYWLGVGVGVTPTPTLVSTPDLNSPNVLKLP